MKNFYDIAVLENEGAGTAYEYLIKCRFLDNLVSAKNPIKTIFIAGLPEKYGYSADIVSFCEDNNIKFEIVDERRFRASEAEAVLKNIIGKDICVHVRDLTDLKGCLPQAVSDIAISCEVLQRIDSFSKRILYIRYLKDIAGRIILFMPNGDNKGIGTYSGLNSVSNRELTLLLEYAGIRHYDIGYIDMPPWPPGIKANIIMKNPKKFEKKFILFFLKIFSFAEKFYPGVFKKRYAHIIYTVI